MNRIGTTARLALPLVAVGVLAAACGSSGGSGANATNAAGGGGGSGSAGAVTVKAESGSAGMHLTDGSGRALYLWTADTSGKSTCSGACASEWPPLTVNGKPAAAGGVQASDLGTVARSGGGEQVTYDGHPLYYYAGDTEADDTYGQGSDNFGAKWWLVAPSGSAITSSAGSSPSTAAPSYNY
jgi:predicted lipoprotein with Yx(FWY)xxD motif